jgi:hypothetical protein
MRRVLISFALLVAGTFASAQTAISLPSYTTPAGVAVTYWIPTNVTISSGTVSFCVVGYVNKTVFTGGSQPVPGASHCYSNATGTPRYDGLISTATYNTYWPSTLTLNGIAAAAVSTAFAVTDMVVAGAQNVWLPNQYIALNTVIYDGSHFQKATTAGWVNASTAPTWNRSGGTTSETCGVTNGCAVWTDQGASASALSFFNGGSSTN